MLGIYSSADSGSKFSDDGGFATPFSVSIDGVTGGAIEKRLYVRNDNGAKNYSSIQVLAVDGGDDLVDGSTGYSWKFIAGDSKPTSTQWANESDGNTISLSDILDTTTYAPFWVRIEVPLRAPVSSFQSVSLRIDFDES